MRRFSVVAMSCILCLVWIIPVDAARRESRRRKRSSLSSKYIRRISSDVPAPDRAEARSRRAAAVETIVNADAKERVTKASVGEKMVRIETRREQADAEFVTSQERIRAADEQRQAALSRGDAEVRDLSMQAEIDYEKGMSVVNLGREISLNEVQKLEAVLEKEKLQRAAEILKLEKDLNTYITATQAKIEKLTDEIGTIEQEETAKFTDLRKQAGSVSDRVGAETERLREETKGFEQNELAWADKLNADANALEKDYRAEVSRLRADASSVEKQGQKDYETQALKIGRLSEKYSAAIAKFRTDAESAQAMLDADVEAKSADVVHRQKAELAEIASLKEALENDLANKKKNILEWQAEADAMEQETDADEIYQNVRDRSEKIRINKEKEIEVVRTVSEAKEKTSEWQDEEEKLEQEERKAAEAAGDAGKRMGFRYTNVWGRDVSVARVIKRGRGGVEMEVLTEAAGRKPGKDLRIGEAVDAGFHDGRMNIAKSRIRVESLRKMVSAETAKLEADRNEFEALIEAREKKLEAAIRRGNAVIEAERMARQANIDLIRVKANELEKAHGADIERLTVENESDMKKTMAHVALLRAQTDKVDKGDGAEVAVLRATAEAIEANTKIEVRTRTVAIGARLVQGQAMGARLLAEADMVEADMLEVLIAKNARASSDRKVLDAVVAAAKSEIDSKAEMAAASEKLQEAEIVLARTVVGCDEEKLLAELESVKIERDAIVAERQKLIGIMDAISSIEIQQMVARADADKASEESGISVDEIRLAAFERSSLADVKALRVEAGSENRKIIADLNVGRARGRAGRVREHADTRLARAEAITYAENAAADAERQNHAALEAYRTALKRAEGIKRVLHVKRVFEEEKAPIKIEDHSKKESAALAALLADSPIPTLAEMLAD